ncbi:MAG: metal ABC transporter permease [Elusimicrobiota bacterium]
MIDFFNLPFIQTSLTASLFAGMALSLLGFFIVMKRLSISGLAVSQMSALGTVLGILIGNLLSVEFHHISFAPAFLAVLGSFSLLSILTRVKRISSEIWVSLFYVLGAAISILILSKAPWGEAHTLNIFFGNVLTLGKIEVVESIILFLMTVLILGSWFRRWTYISFDAQAAEVSGIKIKLWDIGFYALFSFAMTLSIHLFGVFLAFAYLILPTGIALLLFKKLRAVLLFIPTVTFLTTLLGFMVSFFQDFPTGPMIASFLAGITVIAGIFYLTIHKN